MAGQLWPTVWDLRRQADGALSEAERGCAPIRCARQFAYVVDHLPITLAPDASLAGDIDMAALPEPVGQATARSVPAAPTPEELMRMSFHCFGGYSPAHTCVDYELVIKEGFSGIIGLVQDHEVDAVGPARDMLTAMRITLENACRWADRFAELAHRQATLTAPGPARQRLEEIAATCSRVPRRPSASFRDALQAIWLTHVLVGLSEGSSASLSLGRLDQYLLPFYVRDIREGLCVKELKQQLGAFFRTLNTFGDAACAVNIGGLDAEGGDQYNELSELIVAVVTELGLPSPILAVRHHERVPDDRFSAFLDPRLLAMGQPTFYGERACRAAMRERAIPESRVHDWAVNSCMGLVAPGREISNMWGGVVPALLPFELAINGGRPIEHELPIALSVDVPASYCSFEHFRGVYVACLAEIAEFAVAHCKAATTHVATHGPNPFLSALIGDCIARARDRADGGARYHIAIIEAFGLVNAADALYTVRELVFGQQRCTLPELRDALERNYAGAEELLSMIRGLPKYGNGDPDVDTLVKELSDTYAEIISAYSDDTLILAPSFHTLNAHVHAGAIAAASADGRRQGDPLAKNVGAMPGNLRNSHTGLTLSASAIDQSRFFGGQALDLSVDPAIVMSVAGRRTFRSLLDTYFDRGGLQIQVNGLSAATLRAAREHPDQHRDLTVRIGGYSARFVGLAPAVQEEMIARFENGV